MMLAPETVPLAIGLLRQSAQTVEPPPRYG